MQLVHCNQYQVVLPVTLLFDGENSYMCDVVTEVKLIIQQDTQKTRTVNLVYCLSANGYICGISYICPGRGKYHKVFFFILSVSLFVFSYSTRSMRVTFICIIIWSTFLPDKKTLESSANKT